MKKFFSLLLLASLGLSSYAQSETGVKNTKKTKPEAKQAAAPVKPKAERPVPITFSMSMLEGSHFDLKFPGFSVEKVIDEIEKLSAGERGEFESTADYNSRSARALQGRFLGDNTVDSLFAFVFPVSRLSEFDNDFKYSFNPDSGEVNLFALPRQSFELNGIGAPDYKSNRRQVQGLDRLGMSSRVDRRKTYQARNAYGTTVTVEQVSMTSSELGVNKIQFLDFDRPFHYTNPSSVATFVMESSRAAEELPQLKVLVVLKPAAPYVYYHFWTKQPKIDSPIDGSYQSRYLTGDVMGIVYYSGKTGEIFARLPKGFGLP